MNKEVYLSRMAASVQDKLFFTEFVPEEELDFIVDYGCADGTLTRAIAELYPNAVVIGYDINKEFLEEARKQSKPPNLFAFFSEWREVEDAMSVFLIRKKALILSSVLHEVYSYGDTTFFWEQVVGMPQWDYICVRDMGMRKSDTKAYIPNSIALPFSDCIDEDDELWAQCFGYQTFWGNIATYKNLCDFLLKYRYKENWAREVRENYLPLTVEEVIENMRPYTPIYFRHWTLPYINDCVKKDFGFPMPCATNYKAVFVK